jgi:hypothetical protein
MSLTFLFKSNDLVFVQEISSDFLFYVLGFLVLAYLVSPKNEQIWFYQNNKEEH